MAILAVDTSQDRAQLLVFEKNQILGEEVWEKSKSHSEKISSGLIDLLKKSNLGLSDLQEIICVHGPGSFTGIRVGVNFCRTLSYSLSCSVTLVNSLDLLALNAIGSSLPILSVMDAQKNSVFLSRYDTELNPIQTNLVVPIQKLDKVIKEPHVVCGKGFDSYLQHMDPHLLPLIQIDPTFMQTDLKKILIYGNSIQLNDRVSWQQVHPLYIKASAPEELLKPTTF